MYIIFNVLLTHTVMRKVLLSLTSMMLVVSTAFAQIQVGAGYLNSADRVKANEDADAMFRIFAPARIYGSAIDISAEGT